MSEMKMQSCWRFARCLFACCVSIVVGWAQADSCWAQPRDQVGKIVTIGDKDGFLTIDYFRLLSPAGSGGKLFVEVSTSAPVSTFDRNLEIELQLAGVDGGAAPPISVHLPVVLPEGKKSVTAELSFPPTISASPYYSGSVNEVWDVRVREDGSNIESSQAGSNLRLINATTGEQAHQHSVSESLAFLIIGTDPQMLLHRGLLIPSMLEYSAPIMTSEQSPLSGANTLRYGFAVSPDLVVTKQLLNKPVESWKDFLQFNVVMIDASSLELLIASHPTTASHLRTYLMSGGSLSVFSDDVPKDANLVSTWLCGNASNVEVASALGPVNAFGENESSPSKTPTSDQNNDKEKQSPNSTPKTGGLSFVAYDAPNNRSRLAKYFLGSVEVVENRGISSRGSSQVQIEHQQSVATRVSPLLDGSWYFRNMIESVGKPPIWIFCGLVVLFGIVIGPGLLIFTGKLGRRSLLVLLIPGVSVVTTILILASAILHGGMGTSARVSSVVVMDAKSRDGFAWSRQTYFSGWPPSAGLTFGRDTYFRQVSSPSSGSRMYKLSGSMAAGSHIFVNEKQQRWGSWLRSSQQQQFLAGHPVQGEFPIELKARPDAPPLIVNRTKTNVICAVARGVKDDFYITEDLAPNDSQAMESRNAEDLRERMSTLRGLHLPSMPSYLQGLGFSGFSSSSKLNATEVIDFGWYEALDDLQSIPEGSCVLILEGHDFVELPIASKVAEQKQVVIGRNVW